MGQHHAFRQAGRARRIGQDATRSCAGSIETAADRLSIAIDASDGDAGRLVNRESARSACRTRRSRLCALSASALTVNSIFALPSFNWNGSSSGVLTGFDVCTIAPSFTTAKNTTGHSGTFGDHNDTTSPFLMPRAEQAGRGAPDLFEQRAVSNGAPGQPVRHGESHRGFVGAWPKTCRVRFMSGDRDVWIRAAVRHGGADYSVGRWNSNMARID